MRTEKGKYVSIFSILLITVLLTVFESDFLFRLEEQNLFLHTPLFFQQHMMKAGGLLTWTGCYLTQFFYYPMLGTGILCLLWVLFMWLCKRAFLLQNIYLTLIPIACLVLTITTLGYWVFYLKLPGHAFCATIGSIMTVALVWGYRVLPRRYHLPSVYIVFTAGAGYLLIGFYALMATILIAIIAWCKEKTLWNDSIFAIIQVIAWPLMDYFFYSHGTNIVNIYWAALPVFVHLGERCFAYNIPYIILFASMILMALAPSIKKTKWVNRTIILVVTLSLFIFWNRDDNLHRELSMMRSIEDGQWEKVLETAKGVKGEPTRAMCMMQNLALYRLGRMGNEMFKYPNGAKRPNAPFPIRTVHTQGKLLYLHYGVPNYCHRWCVEDGVEYGWSAEKLKLMAKCALLNKEPVAAMRFVNLLNKTDFHKAWAKQYKEYIQNPALVYRDKELKPILPLLHQDNFLTGDQSQLEMFLVEQILSSPIENREQEELARLTQYYYRNNRFKIVEQ